MAKDEFYAALGQVNAAQSYVDVFPVADERSITHTYRTIMRHVHPDVVEAAYRDVATQVVAVLGEHYQRALAAAKNGSYGSCLSDLVFETAKRRYVVDQKISRWVDMTVCYQATSQTGEAAFIKLASSRRDNDLLAVEAEALETFWSGDPKRAMFFPKLIESFGVIDGSRRLRANAIEWCEGFVNLEQVAQAYPKGVDPLDATWMWRRMLWALDYAHSVGYVHGATLPQNVMIHPEMHGLILTDWCYATKQRSGKYQPQVAIVGRQKDWYTKELLAKHAVTPRDDIVLAGRTAVYLLGGDPIAALLPPQVPLAMQHYFKDVVLGNRYHAVAEAAIDFEELLQALGRPFYPRAFRPFHL